MKKTKSLFSYSGTDCVQVMSETLTKLMISELLANDTDPIRGTYTDTVMENEDLRDNFIVQVLHKRLQAANVSVSGGLFMSIVSESKSPAIVVMWSYALFDLLKSSGYRDGKDLYDTNILAEVFPMGLPSDATYKQAWTDQKRSGATLGNSLDDPDTWV